jgi:hypothetical protein
MSVTNIAYVDLFIYPSFLLSQNKHGIAIALMGEKSSIDNANGI